MWEKHKYSLSFTLRLLSTKNCWLYRFFYKNEVPKSYLGVKNRKAFCFFLYKNSFTPYIIMLVMLYMFIIFVSILHTLVWVSKNTLSTILLVNVSFVFVNLWYYFINVYRYGNYTSSIQRFWKRTLTLFWLSELSLFIVFIYLWLVSPSETTFFIDKHKEHLSFFFFLPEDLFYLFTLTLLSYLWYSLYFQKKKGTHTLVTVLLFFFLVCLFLVEFMRIIQVFNVFSSKSLYNFNITTNQNNNSLFMSLGNNIEGCYRYNPNTQPLCTINKRTSFHFNNITLFLRFWHFVFILLLAFLTVQKTLSSEPLSLDMVSANYQNNLVLFLFFSFNYLVSLKTYLHVFLKQLYFWFYEDYSLRDFTLFLLTECLNLLKFVLQYK